MAARRQGFLSGFWFRMTSTERFVFMIIAAIVLYLAYKYAKSFFSQASAAATAKGEISALEAAGQKASYSDSKYESMANQLYNAMDGVGTDEEAVMTIIKQLKNDVDFVKLDAAFGLRAGSSWFASSDPNDLATWLSDDGLDVTAINAQLKKQNITKRF